MIGVFVPFTRPKFIENVLENFQRQTHKEKLLIIVENGPGKGTFPRSKEWIVTTSDHHRSHARNKGIETVRRAGIPYWAVMEDDDWYADDYLSEVWEQRHIGTVTGKASWLQVEQDGTLWQTNPGKEYTHFRFPETPGFNTGLLAATLAGWSKSVIVPFRPEIEYGEETIWFQEMSLQGNSLWSRGPAKYTLIRYSDPEHNHAWSEPLTREVKPKNPRLK